MNGAEQLRSRLADFTAPLVINGNLGDDDLTVDFSGGNPVPASGLEFHGGQQNTAAGDLLSIIGSFTTQVLNYIPPGADGNNGDLDLDGAAILYTGLEPINAGNSVDTILNLPAGLSNNAVLQNSAVAGEIEILDNGATFEDTVFPNPTGSLTINLGNQGDTLQVNTLDSGFAVPLTVLGGDGADTIDASGTNLGLTISGGDGDDIITGSQGDDTINGNRGADTVLGLGGNDTIIADAADTVDGGPGSDTITQTIVNSTGDDTTAGDGLLTLREAILVANDSPGADTITFDPAVFSTSQTINLASQLPTIIDDLTIDGPTTETTTIDP